MYGKVKSNAAVYSAFLSLTNRLPARVVYREPYFAIRTLLEQADSDQDVRPQLASRLASVLRTAITQVPHYRSLGLGVRPEEIDAENVHEVFARFPYLEKHEIMQAPESFVSDAHAIQRLTPVTSGGSTGVGIKMYRSAAGPSAEAAFFQHKWATVGYVRSARVARMSVEGIRSDDEEPCSRSGDRLLVSPYHFNERWIGRVYSDIEEFGPLFIHAYPSCFEYLADYMEESGSRLPSISGIFLASERITDRQLDLADRVFEGVPVLFHYGMCERTNLAWGSRLDGAITYNLEGAYGFSENLVHANGAHEIVGTSYWNEVMPLIRYRTQDYGEIRDGIIHRMEGREQEFLVTQAGATIPGFSVDIDQFTWDYVELVQVVQNEPGRVEFHVKPRAQYNDAAGRRILASQQAKWGDYFDLSLVVTDHIERAPSGKMRLVVINLPERS